MDESDIKAHWERIYHSKLAAELSWHQSASVRSLELASRVPRTNA